MLAVEVSGSPVPYILQDFAPPTMHSGIFLFIFKILACEWSVVAYAAAALAV